MFLTFSGSIHSMLPILNEVDYQNLKKHVARDKYKCQAISFVNPFSYYMMIDGGYAARGIDGFFIDGGLLCKLFQIKFRSLINRISFDYSSIADDFLKHCEYCNVSVSFIGGKSDEINDFIIHIKSNYPNLKLGFCRDGYFDTSTERHNTLKLASQSDVVVIGMGAPLQEEFTIDVKNTGGPKLVLTCGGFITQTSIRGDYYFPIVKRLNLRWLQRILLHKHVRNKVLREYPKFLLRFLREKTTAPFFTDVKNRS